MIKKNCIILTIICLTLLTVQLYSYRSYTRWKQGPEAVGIGGAYTADASSELSWIYNPAGAVQLTNRLSINWEAATMVRVDDILTRITVRLDRLETISYFGVHYSVNGQFKLGFSYSTLFYSYFENNNSLNVKPLLFSAAYKILPNLSVGAGAGLVWAYEQTGNAFSFTWNAGLLWSPVDNIQFGAFFTAPIALNWINPYGLASLYEEYPAIMEAGAAWAFHPDWIGYASLEYRFVDGIRYNADGVDSSPVFGGNVLARLIPHLGFRFLERLSGAHLSFGFMSDAVYYQTGAQPIFHLTAGARFFGRNTVLTFAIVDSLLISAFYHANSRDEEFHVSFSYQFY